MNVIEYNKQFFEQDVLEVTGILVDSRISLTISLCPCRGDLPLFGVVQISLVVEGQKTK